MKQFFSHGANHTRSDVLADWLEKREPFKNSTGSFRGECAGKVDTFGWLNQYPADVERLNHAAGDGLLDYVVYSYETPIVWHVKGIGWIDPGHSYSKTTAANHYGPARVAIGYLEHDN